MTIKNVYNGLKKVVKVEEAPDQIKDLSKRIAELESQSKEKDHHIKTLQERLMILEQRSLTQSDTWRKEFSEALVEIEVLARDGHRCREELKELSSENHQLILLVTRLQTKVDLLVGFASGAAYRNLPPAD